VKLAVYDEDRIGVVEGDCVYDVTEVAPAGLRDLRVHVNWLIGNWASALPKVRQLRAEATAVPLSAVRLLPPSPHPSHIFAAPANYRKHIGELRSRTVSKNTTRENGFFLKAPGSLAGPADGIRLPRGSIRRFDHESELAVIIGKRARNVPRSQALAHVFGYSCLVDLTMRIEPGTHEEERSMRKSFETFTPLGPYLVTADEVGDPQALGNRLWVNGKLRQEANTKDMIVGVAELIELISSVLPLNPGDVVASGTPEGVGPVGPGDRVKISIDRVGEMVLLVTEQPETSPRAY
jgi:2-keto-4-pentenoate hydratase/2-oxohepta-3-ene-1,7-dioic acid hydratase in catechol pathway